MVNNEKYYRKKENGRYEFVGYSRVDLYPGLWLIRGDGTGKEYNNMFYRMADIPDNVEVADMVKCTILGDLIAKELSAWRDEGRLQSNADAGRHIAEKIYEKIYSEKQAIRKLDKHLAD